MNGISGFALSACAAVGRAGAECAGEMEQYAKQNRPWTDRTGNARRTMEGVFGWGKVGADGLFEPVGPTGCHTLVVGVEGNMPYSVNLELSFDGRYSILAPTVHHFAPEIMSAFAGALKDVSPLDFLKRGR